MNREADKSGAVHDREGSPGLKHQTTMKHSECSWSNCKSVNH